MIAVRMMEKLNRRLYGLDFGEAHISGLHQGFFFSQLSSRSA
jgi:hypothetical protein